MREGAQQVERRSRLAICLDLPARIGHARFRREREIVDDVAAVARQFDAVALLGRRRARLGELPGDAANLHHRRAGREGEHHRHLQEHAEIVADVVGAMLGEALGAIAALQQESIASRDPPERRLQRTRLTCKNQRRKRRKLRLHVSQSPGIRIIRHLDDGLFPPAIGRPTLGHHATLQSGGFRRQEFGPNHPVKI